MICGITSPARFTCTTSPTRRSLRATRSKLCSVASCTCVPPISTGSRTAYGLIAAGAPHVHLDREQRRLGDVGRELSRDRVARLASADDAEVVPEPQVESTLTTPPSMAKSSRAAHACSTSCAHSCTSVERLHSARCAARPECPSARARRAARTASRRAASRRPGARPCSRRSGAATRRGGLGIELAQRARGRVARIREHRLARRRRAASFMRSNR